MKFKVLLSSLMAIALMISPVAYAAEFVDVPVKEYEPDSAALEEIIKLVKPKLSIPEEYSVFEWYFSGENIYSDHSWELMWSSEKSGEGHVSVSCDDKGRITNYYSYKQRPERSIPVYLKEELEGTALDFVKKIAPDAKLVLSSSQGYYSDYNGAYTYRFVREENGIKYPSNTATVRVDYATGEVTSFYLTYDYDVTVEAAENIISAEKAAEILSTKQKMELSYVLNTKDVDGKRVHRAVLVYSPALSYVSVDAVTGEIYLETSNASRLPTGAGDKLMGGVMNDSASKEESAEDEYRLTEEELEQLGVLESLIKKEDAVAVIMSNDSFYFDSALMLTRASLDIRYDYRNDPDDSKKYVWNLEFSTPFIKNIGNKYASACVDAHSGELVSYYCQLKNYIDYESTLPEIKYSEEECIGIFEGFLKDILPEKAALTGKTQGVQTNIVIRELREDGKYNNTYGAYCFSKIRENEGIPFNYDGIYATVDAISGKISEFSYSWHDSITFDSPGDAIGEEKALESYLSLSDFDTYYERYDEYSLREDVKEEKYEALDVYAKESTARLVYNVNPESTVSRISALEGVEANYSGEPTEILYEGEISDISSHWAQRDIKLLRDLAIIKNEELFRPDEAITKAELEAMVNAVCGIYKAQQDDSATVTRLDAIKYAVEGLGYGKVASLSGIYKTDYADKDTIPENSLGYLAIAHGLGIVDGDANVNTVRPNDTLTRAEAARLVCNIIKAK